MTSVLRLAFCAAVLAVSSAWAQSYDSLESAGVRFATGATSSTKVERMRITQGGLIGISNTAPIAKLDVGGDIATSGVIQVSGSALTCSSATKGAIRYSNTSSTLEYCNSTAWASMGPSSTQPISFRGTNGSAQGFSASTYTKLNFATEDFDTNTNFASSRFTVTVPGKYLFAANALLTGLTSAGELYIYKNGVQSGIATSKTGISAGLATSGVLDMGIGDYVEVYAWGNGSPNHYQSYNQFSGVLLSPQGSGSGGSGVSAMASLTDVTLTNLAGRDYLRYDTGTSKWVNISESTVMSTTTMLPNWPDAIVCTVGTGADLDTFDPLHAARGFGNKFRQPRPEEWPGHRRAAARRLRTGGRHRPWRGARLCAAPGCRRGPQRLRERPASRDRAGDDGRVPHSAE